MVAHWMGCGFLCIKMCKKFKIQCTVFQNQTPLGFCLRSLIQESYFKLASAALWMYHQEIILPTYGWLPAVSGSHVDLSG